MSEHDPSDPEFDEHMKLAIELLLFGESRIRVLASDGPIGDAARSGFLMRTEVRLLGFGADQVKVAALKLLEDPDLIARVADMKEERGH